MTRSDLTAVESWLARADRSKDWSGVHATVLGLGVSGFAAADALMRVGAQVSVVDHASDEAVVARGNILETLGASLSLGPQARLPVRSDLVIPSPGLPPAHPWLAARSDELVWSGEQLAWRLRPMVNPAPWLVLSGTNGKTTTVEMAATILRAAGRRAEAVGNVGRPLVEAVFAEPEYDVLAVELSSFQLHWTDDIHAHTAALLNIADDHADWHESSAAYVSDKAKVFHGATNAIIYNGDDPMTETLARQADVSEGCRGIGFSLAAPQVGMLGVVDGVLVDRAFVENRQSHAVELIDTAELSVRGSHNVANALAAAALTRSFGASPQAVKKGLVSFTQADHRLQVVAEVDGVTFVDDSKATNVHAADVSLAAFDRLVWIAGGLAKGGQFDELISRHAHRLVGVVLLGVDRGLIRDAIERHAPDVPVIEVGDGETKPMDIAVQHAFTMASPTDRVLLAPACASMDLFVDYAARGAAFQAAVRRLGP